MSPRNLRDNVSRKLGLINGYFFGIIHDNNAPVLKYSNEKGGAAEDIERTLRSYNHHGILRLNFACAVAKVWKNSGGLQDYFEDTERRQQAHAAVLQDLCQEFPSLLRLCNKSPNGCRFIQQPEMTTKNMEEEETDFHSNLESEHHLGEILCETNTAPSQNTKRFLCAQCSKSYTRKETWLHHMRVQHPNDSDFLCFKSKCPMCNRLFLREKDMKVHLRGKRCGSKQGKYAPEFALADSR